MRRYRLEIMTLISIAVLITIPIILNNAISNGENDEPTNDDGYGNDIYWGVDSASYTDENLMACVVENFGQPLVWGRYLGEREGVSAGLDSEEVSVLHENEIRILVIYNHVNDVTGYENGVEHAEQAIQMAKELGVAEGVALFLNIEPEYPVNSGFIEGWYNTLSHSIYEAGVYGLFDEERELMAAFNELEVSVQENIVVWTAYPQEEITTKENAPEFNPQGPNNAKVYGWQYAIEADTCNIDTNLFRGEMFNYLW